MAHIVCRTVATKDRSTFRRRQAGFLTLTLQCTPADALLQKYLRRSALVDVCSIDALASAHRRFFDLDQAHVCRSFDAQAPERSAERPLPGDEAVRQDVGHDDRLYGKLDRLSSTTQADDTLQ